MYHIINEGVLFAIRDPFSTFIVAKNHISGVAKQVFSAILGTNPKSDETVQNPLFLGIIYFGFREQFGAGWPCFPQGAILDKPRSGASIIDGAQAQPRQRQAQPPARTIPCLEPRKRRKFGSLGNDTASPLLTDENFRRLRGSFYLNALPGASLAPQALAPPPSIKLAPLRGWSRNALTGNMAILPQAALGN